MRNFHDPSEPVLGCSDCGTPVHPEEETCFDCLIKNARPVYIPAWPMVVTMIILGLASALLVPIIAIYLNIWRG